MTATATAAPTCPICGAAMYDNRLTKKNPKQPDFKCTQYKQGCEGVIWPPKGVKAAAPAKPPVVYAASKPQEQLPPFLQDAEAQDSADLAAKVGFDISGIEKQLSLYQGIAEWASRELPKVFSAGKDAVGMTPESLAACVNTIFINTAGKK